jgi:5-methylcytosine-specific restriction endonuclease McrA
VFDREKGICHLYRLPIQAPGQKWDCDHVVALINGGENRESNLKPAHRECNKEKTERDVAEKVKVAAIRARHIGAKEPKQKIKSRPKEQKPARDRLPPLPPRSLYVRGELLKPLRGRGHD